MAFACPHCSAPNRPAARFCMRCGQRLTASSQGAVQPAPSAGTPGATAHLATSPQALPATTAKVCPRCQQSNAIGARACQKCGYRFITSAPQPSYWRKRLPWAVAIVAVFAVSLWGGSVVVNRLTPEPPLDPATALQRAVLGTVQILTPDESQPDRYSAGSGTVIRDNGYILTNFHVIGDPDSGRLYNQDALILVAVPMAGTSDPPTVRYRAELVDTDLTFDLALLRVSALEDGRPLPRDLGLAAVPIADSDLVEIGDQITVLGYPGLGGETITLTRGTVAGFLEDWIKTDAETNYGNSGGAAVNAAGELVGVPTAGASEDAGVDRLPGKIGLIRPINLAKKLLDQTR